MQPRHSAPSGIAMHQSFLSRAGFHKMSHRSISGRSHGKSRLSRPLILALMLALLVGTQHPAVATPARAQDKQPGASWLTTRNGQSFFVVGANYEGPTDRAWKMWDR